MSMLPPLRVKISSEDTDMALTPVVARDMTAHELVLQILVVTGKNPERVREILQRGSFTAGGSRLRWTGITVEDETLRQVLAPFPDADPSRPFEAARCRQMVLRSGSGSRERHVSVTVEMAAKRRWFQRLSFWDAVMRTIPQPAYHDYSYRETADVYRAALSVEQRATVSEAQRLLKFPVPLPAIEIIDLYVPRA